MCDCYGHPCCECGELLPVHIEDFCMGREEVLLYCGTHLPDRNVVVYTITESEDEPDGPDEVEGFQMGVRYLVSPPEKYGLNAVGINGGPCDVEVRRVDRAVFVFDWDTWCRDTIPEALLRPVVVEVDLVEPEPGETRYTFRGAEVRDGRD